MDSSSSSRRFGVAAVLAVLVHGGLAFISLNAEVKQRLPDEVWDAIEVVPWEPPEVTPPPEELLEPEEPPEEPEEPEPPEEVTPPPEPPPPEPPPPEPPEPVDEPPPEPPPEDAPEAPTDEVPAEAPPATGPTEPLAPPPLLPDVVEREDDEHDDASDSIVRLPKQDGPRKGSLLGRVMGSGSDPFGTGLGTLEGALEFKADGPMSDKERAAKMAKRMLESEMAADAVAAGLADDYFRELKVRLETAWRPAAKDLNDAGESTSRVGMMKNTTTNTAAWGEMFKLYQEMAQQYGGGRNVQVNRDRLEKARELFRSKKGNFRTQAIAEVMVTQAKDGKVLTVEFITPTGHDRIDESIKDAIMTAVAVMPYEPPHRLSFGHAFRSKWRMRATWKMVPPTSMLTGNSFDISQQGVEVDIPFQIKLTTKVMLLSFDNKSRSVTNF